MSPHAVSETSPSAADVVSTGLCHVAVIMDGNRRWAQRHGLPASAGHYQGYQALKTIVDYASRELHLPALTVYAFSTENWGRSDTEVIGLQQLFQEALLAETPQMVKENLRLRFLGDLTPFSPEFQQACHDAQAMMADNTGMIYQVALNYGSRAELTEACRRLAQAAQAGQVNLDRLTDEQFRHYLYTGGTPDPDLVIRTGGASRLSNFLLWQSAYAEICIVEELWPDFTPAVFARTIQEFHRRQRRFGR